MKGVFRMKKPKRIVDINGIIINEPQHYHESLKWAREMVQEMENDNVDRSDMQVVIERLSEEVRFTLLMLRERS